MLESIQLRNFKCFENPDKISFNKINIFTGYNGAGKSSVFQSILLLAQSIENNELNKIRANGRFVNLGTISDLICKSAKDEELTISICNTKPDYTLEFKIQVNPDNDRLGKITGFVLNGQDQFAESGIIGNQNELDSLHEPDIKYNAVRQLQCADWSFVNLFKNIQYVSAGRLGPTLYEERSEVDLENPLGDRGEHRLEVLRSRRDIISKIEKEITYIMETDMGISLGESEESHSVLNLNFKNKDNEGIKSVNTGFGFTYILPLLIAMESQNGGKVFIENPEAHLHPRAQSRLIQVLVKGAIENDNQLFIETHSEHIINGVRLSCLLEANPVSNKDVEIYFFDADKQIIRLNVDENAQLNPWPEGFFDQQQKDSSEILQRGLLRQS